jgi:hypothetical protein
MVRSASSAWYDLVMSMLSTPGVSPGLDSLPEAMMRSMKPIGKQES